jgi:hypothetical protein
LSDLELSPLLAHLVEQGEAIAQFREVATDLEDAFLSVTQDDTDSTAADQSGTSDSEAGSEEQAASS